MQMELPWDKKTLTLNVPDTWEIIFPEKTKTATNAINDEAEIVRAALRSPTEAIALADKNLGNKNIVIIVDDNTRPTPVYKFFHLVLEDLQSAGANLAHVTTITALGIHTPMTEAEMADKIGTENLEKIKWENHNAFDNDMNAYMGETRRGTPVYLNKRLQQADFILLIGLIEPHLMAGFGGGMKNILPGVASALTIGLHHEILTEPPYQANRVGVMPESNLFRLDLEETRDMISADIFCVNAVIDHDGNITACFAGDPIASHRLGIDYTASHFGIKLDKQVDGIITNSYPMDLNFKQSMKCVGNALPALKPKGVVMGFLRAEKGLDDIAMPDGSPLPLPLIKGLLRLLGPSKVYGFLNTVKKGMSIEEKFLYYYTLQLIRQYELYLYVPSLTPDIIKALFFFKGFRQSPDEVIKMGLKKLGKTATVAVFPEGGASFPIIG